MLTTREITPADHDLVIPMVVDFYHSDAVDHVVPTAMLERSFAAAADPDEPLLRGTLFFHHGQLAGYAYLTFCYSAEVGGRCVFIEEIFLKEEFRGRGLGREIMAWLEQEYPSARRFRLEVTQANQRAVRLYEACGYEYLRYDQMVLDKLN